jgi:hypothetical protein
MQGELSLLKLNSFISVLYILILSIYVNYCFYDKDIGLLLLSMIIIANILIEEIIYNIILIFLILTLMIMF